MFKQLCRLQRYTLLHELSNVFNTFLHELSSYAYTFLHDPRACHHYYATKYGAYVKKLSPLGWLN